MSDLIETQASSTPRLSLGTPRRQDEGAAGETGVFVFGVSLDQPTDVDVVADVTVIGGASGPATVRIPAGEVTGEIIVTFQGDDLTDPDELIAVQLSNLQNAEPGATLNAVTFIINDDGPPPATGLPIITAAAIENRPEGDVGDTPAAFVVTLDRPTNVDVIADVTIVGGAEGPSQIVIPAGQTTISNPFTIPGDTVDEPNDLIYIQLSNVQNAVTVGQPWDVARLLDDDGPFRPAGVAFEVEAEEEMRSKFRVETAEIEGTNNAFASMVARNGVEGVINYVYRGEPSVFDIDVHTFDENDGESLVQILVNGVVIESRRLDEDLGEAEFSEANKVTVSATDAVLRDGDLVQVRTVVDLAEHVRIDKLSFTPTGATPPPEINVTAPENALEGASGETGALIFTATIDLASDVDVVADVTIDGAATGPSTVTIPAGATSADIALSFQGDDSEGPDRPITVSLSNPQNAVVGDASATATILDDDGAAPIIRDRFEDNDTLATAAALAAPEDTIFADLSLDEAGDVDFFEITAARDGALEVSIDFIDANGDLDLEILDANGQVLDRSEGITDQETVNTTAAEGDVLYARVFGFQNAVNAYTLTIDQAEDGSVGPPPPPTGDAFEDNDTRETASVLTATDDAVYADLTIDTSNDVDFFEITAAFDGALEVSIDFTDADGDLDLQLLNASGQVVDSSAGVTDQETVSAAASAGDVFYARVFGFSGATNAYAMTVDQPEDGAGGPPPPTGDRFEDNDTLATATVLAASDDATFDGLSIDAAGDDDFYEITASLDGVLEVSIDFTDANGDLDLELLNAAGQVVASSAGVTDTESVSVSAAAGETFFARVYGFSSATNDYALSIDQPSGETPPPPSGDAFEDNDTLGAATTVAVDFTSDALTIDAPGDQDYFEITAGADGVVSVEIDFRHADGDLDLQLLNSAGAVVETSASVQDGESVSAVAEEGEVFFARVYGFGGAVNAYEMTVDAPAAPAAAAQTAPSAPIVSAVDDAFVFAADGSDSGAAASPNILANDVGDGLFVASVNGQSIGAGATFDLAEGGALFIASDGQVSFDADGDFDDLSAGEAARIELDYTLANSDGAQDDARIVIDVIA